MYQYNHQYLIIDQNISYCN